MKYSRKIILASASPRRQELLKESGIDFEVKVSGINEIYPEELTVEEIPEFLAEKKAFALKNELEDDTLIIAADTIVVLNDLVLEKPSDSEEAFKMLRELSGKKHKVITGVALLGKESASSFYNISYVEFEELSDKEIHFYVNKFAPYDKAGAYAIQEWIGMIGIKRIEGCYYNIVGLPMSRLYKELLEFGEFVY